MTKALELAKFGRETPPVGLVVGDSDTQTLSAKTFSDMPVFSAGVAASVPYLSASKVLTTDSGLTFNGTTLGVTGNVNAAGLTLSGGTVNGVGYLNGSKVFTSGSELTFDGTNFGIGSSAPEAKLTVIKDLTSGGDATGFRLNANTTANRNILFGGPSTLLDASFWQAYREATVGAGTRNLLLNPLGGNVGVGTTTAAWRLTTKASASGTAAVFLYDGEFAGTSEVNVGLRWYNGGNPGDIPQVLLRGYGTTNYTGNFAISLLQGGTYPNPLIERFTIQGNTGNVGIGDSNPGSKLSVAGSATFYGASIDSETHNGIRVGSNSNYYWEISREGVSSGHLRFVQNNNNTINERMRLDSNGNVLIDAYSNTGGGKLDLTSNATAVIQARSTAVGTGDGTANVNVIRAVTSGATWWANARYDAFSHTWGYGGSATSNTAMKIAGDGRVSIGTTTSDEKLTVAGNIRLYGNQAVVFQQLSGVAVGAISFRNSDGVQKAGIGSYYNIADEGAIEFLGPNSSTNMILRSNGRLGIGTTAPDTALDVRGDIRMYTNGTTGGYGLGAIGLPGGARDILLAGQSAFSNGFTVKYTGTVMQYAFQDGNVGIGTTNPSTKLHVDGGLYVSGSSAQGRFITNTWTDLVGGHYRGYGSSNVARYEIMRIAIDYNDWNSVGSAIIELSQNYYSTGGYSKWSVNYGYVQNHSVTLMEAQADWKGASVSIGAPVQVSGDHYYIPVYVLVQGYHQFVARLTSTHTLSASTVPGAGNAYIFASPNLSNPGTTSITFPEYLIQRHNQLIDGKLATSQYAVEHQLNGSTFVQKRAGRMYSMQTYTLFTRGNADAQSSGKVYVQAIYGTPASAGTWEYCITGDKRISLTSSNTTNYGGGTPSVYWSGNSLILNNQNGSVYCSAIVELHNIGGGWEASWGDMPGIVG